MSDEKVRRILLLTDDQFLAEVLGTYMRRDDIEIERIDAPADVARRVAAGADGIVVDIAKRGLSGDAIMTLSSRAERWEIPFLVLTAQPRKDVSEFGAVVRATDVLSKTEAMPSIAARIRLCVRTPLKYKPVSPKAKAENLDWAIA